MMYSCRPLPAWGHRLSIALVVVFGGLMATMAADAQTTPHEQGREALAEQKWGRAASTYRQITRDDPADADAWIGAMRQVDETLRAAGVDVELHVMAGEGHFLTSLAGDGLVTELEPLRRP